MEEVWEQGPRRWIDSLTSLRIEHYVPKRRKNRIREERIHNEVIIDAYGPEENIRLRRPHAFGEASPGTGLFERREENPPLREAIDFYRQAHGWSNRLIAGDSFW